MAILMAEHDIRGFCAEEPLRFRMDAACVRGGRMMATDARVLVSVPIEAERDEVGLVPRCVLDASMEGLHAAEEAWEEEMQALDAGDLLVGDRVYRGPTDVRLRWQAELRFDEESVKVTRREICHSAPAIPMKRLGKNEWPVMPLRPKASPAARVCLSGRYLALIGEYAERHGVDGAVMLEIWLREDAPDEQQYEPVWWQVHLREGKGEVVGCVMPMDLPDEGGA